MSNPVPSSLALTTIADSSPRVAAPVRNNFSAVQTQGNGFVTCLSGGTAGQVLTAVDASNVEWADATTRYSKLTAKAVNTTTTATDLLNAEITLAASKLVAGKTLEAVLFGDFLQNTGSARTAPRLQLVVAGTTVFDTGTSGTWTASATRGGWSARIRCLGLGTASQVWSIDGFFAGAGGSGSTSNVFTTGAGWYRSLGTSAELDATFHGETTSTIDMTSTATFVFNVINGYSNASYETRLNGAFVDVK